jgi:nitroreductase
VTNTELFKTIFKRKSVRKYAMTPLPPEKFTQIQNYASVAKPLDTSIRYEFSYMGEEDVKGLLAIKAPHYICIFSEKKQGYLVNAGYLLQQIDLYLSANHLGSCWLGMGKLSKNIPSIKDGMEFVIMLAFGEAAEPVHRKGINEFNRKSLSDISTVGGVEELLEPVRLAPSATNSQPWLFSGTRDQIIVCREKLNFIKTPLYEKINQIDMGIALYHLMLSLEYYKKTAILDFETTSVPAGQEFIAQVKIGRAKEKRDD